MFKLAVILFPLLLLGCSGNVTKQDSDDIGYFSDSSDCFRSSVRKEQIKVPTAKTNTIIEIPIGNDADLFSQCMEYAGHPAVKVNADEYLNVSRACMKEAAASETPDAAYAKCVRRTGITVETIPPGKSK
ncbi:MAG: hypothetical protein PHH59_01705 [Methylovulum sp.]|uniref:hypothetical protein n=1 Tax=Methylovulum sp. TaxID=1916980 RepID=UPI00261565B2|nr:hypothetical protein [Methylovulum sp.]MDD2722724.1 hypothetical protein [Methylovulum sp.]MDD5123978.1 hypothetical protein [Methylovulum sp.]